MTVTTIDRQGPARGVRRAERTAEIFGELAALDPAERVARRRLLAEVIEINVSVAANVASRFARRGVPVEDLQQVASVALVRAAHAFDSRREGADFLSYAVPCMRGEVRKYFRDHGWMVRPTRRIQELQLSANGVVEELVAELGRYPRPSEVAQRIGAPVGDVVEAMSADGCFSPHSLDLPVGDGGAVLGDILPGEDTEMAQAEARAVVLPTLRRLQERDRKIVALRFYDGLTQREIGEYLGLSQMQVSRHLTRILEQLRHDLEDREPRPAA